MYYNITKKKKKKKEIIGFFNIQSLTMRLNKISQLDSFLIKERWTSKKALIFISFLKYTKYLLEKF